ncbi:MAG TPA: divalent-cation tolerance protein CutA [Gammaproteobacteria bacterium]|nr:divalent-cation tolerance protein CutA [Gammaproteobacteria bacterium]
MNSKYQVVFCTCPDSDTANLIATTLVDRELAACVNILPGVRSIYRWQNKRETSDELLLIIKSLIEVYPALQASILEVHPYELPEIIALPIAAGLPAYLNWMDEQINGR